MLQFGVHSRYYKGELTQKRSFLVICTTFRSVFHPGWKNQNKLSTFNALSKWHESDINLYLAYHWWSGGQVLEQWSIWFWQSISEQIFPSPVILAGHGPQVTIPLTTWHLEPG